MNDILDIAYVGLVLLYGAVAFLVMWLWPVLLAVGIATAFS